LRLHGKRSLPDYHSRSADAASIHLPLLSICLQEPSAYGCPTTANLSGSSHLLNLSELALNDPYVYIAIYTDLFANKNREGRNTRLQVSRRGAMSVRSPGPARLVFSPDAVAAGGNLSKAATTPLACENSFTCIARLHQRQMQAFAMSVGLRVTRKEHFSGSQIRAIVAISMQI
jgi:hypothetical protein